VNAEAAAETREIDLEALRPGLAGYLEHFDHYVSQCRQRNDPYPSIHGKIISFRDTLGQIDVSCQIGVGLVTTPAQPNKIIEASLHVLWNLVTGKFNFESLYIGYNATFYRYPPDVFNKDLIFYLQKFGYVYQKRIAPMVADRGRQTRAV
jgi:hypothetical protein